MKECRNRYIVCGLTEDKLAGYKKLDIEQVYLEGEGLKGLVSRLTGIGVNDIREVSVKKLDGKNFLVAKHNCAEKNDYELEVCEDFVKDYIENYGVKKTVKTSYVCPCENFGSALEVNFYRNRNLIVAQMGYDPYEYDPKYIDRYSRFLIKAIDDKAVVRDISGNGLYEDFSLATNLQEVDEM